MILTSQQVYNLHNPDYTANKYATLTMPLSQDGWNRIDDMLAKFPQFTVAELIEKALVIAWHADNKEFT